MNLKGHTDLQSIADRKIKSTSQMLCNSVSAVAKPDCCFQPMFIEMPPMKKHRTLKLQNAFEKYHQILKEELLNKTFTMSRTLSAPNEKRHSV